MYDDAALLERQYLSMRAHVDFLTGRSTQDSHLVGELMVEVLENGLRRYGW